MSREEVYLTDIEVVFSSGTANLHILCVCVSECVCVCVCMHDKMERERDRGISPSFTMSNIISLIARVPPLDTISSCNNCAHVGQPGNEAITYRR